MITKKEIILRHQKYPESTELLIEQYGFQQYKKAISDLFLFGKISKINNTEISIIAISDNDLKNWIDYLSCDWYMNKNELLNKKG